MKRVAFNDMIGKGWDSAKQESFCWQNFVEAGGSENPGDNQFWWVPRVWRDHGHAWNWEEHVRDDKGLYVSFPSEGPRGGSDTTAQTAMRLLRLATLFDQQHSDQAKELIKLASSIADLKTLNVVQE